MMHSLIDAVLSSAAARETMHLFVSKNESKYQIDPSLITLGSSCGTLNESIKLNIPLNDLMLNKVLCTLDQDYLA